MRFPDLPPEDAPAFLADVNTPEFLEAGARNQQEHLSDIIGLICLTDNPLHRCMWLITRSLIEAMSRSFNVAMREDGVRSSLLRQSLRDGRQGSVPTRAANSGERPRESGGGAYD